MEAYILITLEGKEKLTLEQIYNLIGKIMAIIYVRVSSADQVKNYSLESQIEACKNRAITKFGFKESELIVVVEAGGMGDDPNRPALNNALYLLEKGLGKKLIILHPDRLTRDNTLQGVVSRRIWNMGVDIEFIEFEVDPDNPESMLMYNIQGSIAQYNKAKIHANSRRGRIQKAKKGQIPSFRRMYGYTYNKKEDNVDINEDEKNVILEMIDMLLNQDMSCNQIAQDLSERGIDAPSGDIWYQTTVTRILRNKSYTGEFYYGKTKVMQINGEKKQLPRPKEEWIKIKIPNIMDQKTYEDVQLAIDRLNNAKGRKSKTYLLKGIARCGRCGSAAGSGITSKTKNGVYKYYSCQSKVSKGFTVGTGKPLKKCKGKNWRVDIVDEIVWNWVVERINNPKLIITEITNSLGDKSKVETMKISRDKLLKQISSLEKEEGNYIVLFGKSKINEKQFDELTAPIKVNLDRLNKELSITENQLSSIENDKNEVSRLAENIEKIQKLIRDDYVLDIEKRRKILRMFVENVKLNENDTIKIDVKWGIEDDSNASISIDNWHKKKVHRQAYGRQTARIYINFGWVLKRNGTFFKTKSGITFAVSISVSFS